jgi:hypothetical protein
VAALDDWPVREVKDDDNLTVPAEEVKGNDMTLETTDLLVRSKTMMTPRAPL